MPAAQVRIAYIVERRATEYDKTVDERPEESEELPSEYAQETCGRCGRKPTALVRSVLSRIGREKVARLGISRSGTRTSTPRVRGSREGWWIIRVRHRRPNRTTHLRVRGLGTEPYSVAVPADRVPRRICRRGREHRVLLRPRVSTGRSDGKGCRDRSLSFDLSGARGQSRAQPKHKCEIGEPGRLRPRWSNDGVCRTGLEPRPLEHGADR